MAITLPLPDKFNAQCLECEWEGELITDELPKDEIILCPECKGYVDLV